MSDYIKGAAIVATGTLEGFAFVQAGVLAPQVMVNQMLFKDFAIMKMFMGAVGSSMAIQAVYSIVDPDAFRKTRQYSKKNLGYYRAVAGCAALGVGMTVAGAGPTLLPSQAAAGVPAAPFMIAGGLFGGIVFGLLEPHIVEESCPVANTDDLSLDKERNYAKFAIPMSAALLGATAALEVIFPYKNSTLHGAWMPSIAGLVIGMNQLPLRLLAGRGQGGSTSFMNIVSTATMGKISKKSQMKSLSSMAQLLYVWVGTSLGAFAATQLNKKNLSDVECFSPLRSFVGGAIMLMGARFADGCTCGHGITGFSELAPVSIAAAMAIFAGGIAAAFAINAI